MTTDTRGRAPRSVRERIRRLTTEPLSMASVHVTDFCNSKCVFCVVNSPIQQIPIETRRLVGFVESYAGRDVDVLNIHGGEATISKALFPVLEAGRRIGIPEAHLQTNGVRLSDPDLVRRLIDAGVGVFVISLHGHTAELQEGITLTPGSFPKILRGIQNCLEAGAVVRTNTVICRANFPHLHEVLSLSCRLGVPWQNISQLHPSKHAMASFRELVVHPALVRAALPDVVRRIRAEHPDAIVELEGFAKCHAPGLEDLHIEDGRRRIQLLYHGEVLQDYERYMEATQRRKTRDCAGCAHETSCNGLYHAYTTEFAAPVTWPVTWPVTSEPA
jgi:MoaA/NifB/PqqE/SkfB family radical SAM enzyme